MPDRPMLDDLELELVQKIDSGHDHVLHQTGVPGLDGDFLASEGRRATRFTLTGVVAGEEAAEDLKALREKFAIADPVPFLADIATATRVENVLIEEMGVREIAGRPRRFEYSFALREYQPPEAPPVEPLRPPPPLTLETGVEVVVRVFDDPSFSAWDSVAVTFRGNTDDGEELSGTLADHEENVWTEIPMTPGRYTFEAITHVPEEMTGSTTAPVIEFVRDNHVEILLRRGSQVGSSHMIHYSFDRSFVEPCIRQVLRDVAGRASSGPPDEKLVIVGHTDKSGSEDYNQGLSERRARGAFAYLTYGRNPAESVAEWDRLRRTGTNLLDDNWGTVQYQHMLQALNYYPGRIDGDHGPLTTDGVGRFQGDNGLAVTGFVNDQTWPVLIDRYMAQDRLSVARAKFFEKCPGEELSWIGCGEFDPADPAHAQAWRPNRRTELIFATAAELPCDEIPRPLTLDLPPVPPGPRGWCLNAAGDGPRCCFLKRTDDESPRILVDPVHKPGAAVTVHMEFGDGSPAAGIQYVLIAPDGTYMDGENETASPRGLPRFGATDNNGNHSYDKRTGAFGIWTVEIQASVLARLREDPAGSEKGPVVCKRLEGDGTIDIILSPRIGSLEFVDADNVDTEIARVVFGQPFRLRADIPGETRDEITVELSSYLIRR